MLDSGHGRHLARTAHMIRGHSTCLVGVTTIDRLDDGAMLGDGGTGPPGPRERRLGKPPHPIVNFAHEVQQHLVVRGLTHGLVELILNPLGCRVHVVLHD